MTVPIMGFTVTASVRNCGNCVGVQTSLDGEKFFKIAKKKRISMSELYYVKCAEIAAKAGENRAYTGLVSRLRDV